MVSGLKKRLDDAKGGWVEELSHVLWTYWISPRRSIGETPFLMTYKVEVVIPFGDWISNAEDELIRSKQQQQPTRKEPGFN